MTKEEKQLLLKDLCARLPYGVKVTNGIHTITLKPCSDASIIIKNEHILPYLRPMSSMTEEEEKELSNYENSVQRTDFFYSHHIDCRFMIEKGIALEAPEDMYKEK